ncbi:costunolide synthase-like protein, partial [Tanacetum coccineum]
QQCEIGGYDIPVKTKVIAKSFACSTDPEYWEDAKTFKPNRFNNSSFDFMESNYEFIPCGSRRRLCPGINFALVSAQLFLAQMLYYFDWKLPDELSPMELDMSETVSSLVTKRVHLPTQKPAATCDGIIVRREAYGFSDNHLLQHSPHSAIHFIDSESYPTTDFNHIPAPRLFATYYARDLLSATITSCKVVYIYRDPKDVLIWYWIASLESPDKILFLKYEEMKMQPKVGSRKLAVFVGKLFTVEEEERRMVAKIVKLCSFEFL